MKRSRHGPQFEVATLSLMLCKNESVRTSCTFLYLLFAVPFLLHFSISMQSQHVLVLATQGAVQQAIPAVLCQGETVSVTLLATSLVTAVMI